MNPLILIAVTWWTYLAIPLARAHNVNPGEPTDSELMELLLPESTIDSLNRQIAKLNADECKGLDLRIRFHRPSEIAAGDSQDHAYGLTVGFGDFDIGMGFGLILMDSMDAATFDRLADRNNARRQLIFEQILAACKKAQALNQE